MSQSIKYLNKNGKLGFFINSTIFTNESSEGFRQFSLRNGRLKCSVELIEDYSLISPFEGVSNKPAFFVVKRDSLTRFPVTYREWSASDETGKKIRQFSNATSFRAIAKHTDLFAKPIPKGNGLRPWIVGKKAHHAVFNKVFGPGNPHYCARKGVTTDRNGIFWVTLLGSIKKNFVEVKNNPAIGKIKGISTKHGLVEVNHLFPLLRGQGVKPFVASPDKSMRILVPQRGMHGDPELHISSPNTFKFLNGFKKILTGRSSYKRFQAKQPFYSLWSTGTYTFAPYKVLWREIGGESFRCCLYRFD